MNAPSVMGGFAKSIAINPNQHPSAIGAGWGGKMLKRMIETAGSNKSNRRRFSPGQQHLPFDFDIRLSQIPEEWQQIAVRFRRANGIRGSDITLGKM